MIIHSHILQRKPAVKYSGIEVKKRAHCTTFNAQQCIILTELHKSALTAGTFGELRQHKPSLSSELRPPKVDTTSILTNSSSLVFTLSGHTKQDTITSHHGMLTHRRGTIGCLRSRRKCLHAVSMQLRAAGRPPFCTGRCFVLPRGSFLSAFLEGINSSRMAS